MLSALLLSSPDYKSFLKKVVEANAHVKAMHSKLAEAAGCQKSYLSKVLNGEAHLVPDHAYGIAEYLGLGESETDYFLDLVQLDRAATPKLRERQQRKLQRLKQKMEDLQNRFRSDTLNEEEQQKLYYSSWVYGAVHMACGIGRLQSAESLARRFHLEPAHVTAVLAQLARMGLVEEKGGKWSRKSQQVHVPFSSLMNVANHMNWSAKSLQDIQLQKEESLHYTAVYSLSKADVDKLKHIMITAIESTRKVVIPSSDEELVCLRVDFFRP